MISPARAGVRPNLDDIARVGPDATRYSGLTRFGGFRSQFVRGRGNGFGLVGLPGLRLGRGVFGFLSALGAQGTLIPITGKFGGGGRFGGLWLVDRRIDEGERNLSHAGGTALAGTGKDDVFHL